MRVCVCISSSFPTAEEFEEISKRECLKIAFFEEVREERGMVTSLNSSPDGMCSIGLNKKDMHVIPVCLTSNVPDQSVLAESA